MKEIAYGDGLKLTDEAFALLARLADGALRKAAHPKKKKLMHLRVEPVSAEPIAERLKDGIAVQDAEIRKYLLALGYNTDKRK